MLICIKINSYARNIKGYPEGGIAPGTKWEDVPEDFECPLCNVGKDQFSEVE